MATLIPTLTITSTDATVDQLSFTVTDSISVTDPFRGMSNETVTTTGGNHIITDAADSTKLIYIRHTGLDGSGDAVTTDLYIEDENNVRWAKLQWISFFCSTRGFFWNYSSGIHVFFSRIKIN